MKKWVTTITMNGGSWEFSDLLKIKQVHVRDEVTTWVSLRAALILGVVTFLFGVSLPIVGLRLWCEWGEIFSRIFS